MNKIKTAELAGAALDWAVAKCEGIINGDDLDLGFMLERGYTPSTDWWQGGPIIEREGICLSCVDTLANWDARIYDGESEPWQGEGNTPLIAAMRCYVASKLGDTIEIPAELLTN